MARKPRIHLAGAVYHVMLRGNAGQNIFFSDEDRQHFEALAAEGITRFGHRIHGYCWMNNHVHLVVQVGNTPLSQIMQHLAFRYTRWVNRRENRVEHLFQGRFKAILVDADSYLLELVRYIHLNPVRAGLTGDPTAWPWSGHRAYLGLTETTWLTTDWLYSQFAQDVTTARVRYAKFVAEGLKEGYREEFHRGNAQGRILGSDNFIEASLSQSDQLGPAPVKLETIVIAVCATSKLDLDALTALNRGRAAAEARALIAYLTIQKNAAPLTRLAKLFNRDLSTLSNAASRIRERINTDSELAAKVKELLKILEIERKMNL